MFACDHLHFLYVGGSQPVLLQEPDFTEPWVKNRIFDFGK